MNDPTADADYQRILELFKAGRTGEAKATALEVLKRRPGHGPVLHSLGVFALQEKRYGDAVRFIEQARALMPEDAECLSNLGVALQSQGRLPESIAALESALRLKPDYSDAHYNLAIAFEKAGRHEESAAISRRLVALLPDRAWTHTNLGHALRKLGQTGEAIACCRRAIEIDPECGQAHWTLAVLLLLQRDHVAGWREYEWRWRGPLRPRTLPGPTWDGSPAPGKTILLYSEQGMGDAIHFIRYVPLVRAHAGARRVLLECPANLKRLLGQSASLKASLVSSTGDAGAGLPAFDLHLPLLSLPLMLGLHEPGNPLVPAPPYVQSNAGLCKTWRKRLVPSRGLRVGIAWAGNPGHIDDLARSCPPSHFAPLAQVSGVVLYSLQVYSGKASSPRPEFSLVDLTSDLTDMADTAALITELDLVITVDTAVAHLAGAMGKPVWMLVAFAPDWRWGLEGSTTPWYPSMRIFRQPSPGAWTSLIQEVCSELRSRADARPPS